MKPYDIILTLPYTYTDHPSFPEAILKHTLQHHGFSVGVIETPSPQTHQDFTKLGQPKLFFAIITGPVDSTVLNYTSTRKRRKEDLYQIEGSAFFPNQPPSIKSKIRPDNAVVVFANRIRQAYKETPIIIGGIEAGLRRFAHYDFQQDKLRRSILLDSRADILVTGMGEKQLARIAQETQKGTHPSELDIPGTACVRKDTAPYREQHYTMLPSVNEILANPVKLMNATLDTEKALALRKGLFQQQDNRFVVEHPPQEYTTQDLELVYGFPYSRSHPGHKGLSQALEMNLFSITSHRGCGGGCTFCSISCHEGKRIISRSPDSIMREIHGLNRHPRFKGIISDIGGATAEMYGADCVKPNCPRTSCLFKKTCPQVTSSSPYLDLLRQARNLKGVRKVFLGSGIRYDLMMRNPELLEEVLRLHSGRFLRIAPEHTADTVLQLMRKPPFQVFQDFVRQFEKLDRKMKRPVELAPYLIIGHPGEEKEDVLEMRRLLRQMKLKTTDVQIFTPTPGTVSTAMYYSGVSPDFKPIAVLRDIKKLMRRKELLTGGKTEGRKGGR